jgi:xanthine dehydrogenase YagT iron-sulfur-binding subunit
MLDASLQTAGEHFQMLARSAGQPLVLVFARDWGQPSPETLDAMRAELRGLGAALLVLGQHSLFWFRADDEPEIEPTEAATHVNELLSRYAVTSEAVAAGRLTLCLLDGVGALRFRSTTEAADSVSEALLFALQKAGKSAIGSDSNARDGRVSRREVIVLSLLGALAAMMAEGCKREQPASQPPKPGPTRAREVPVSLRVNGAEHQLMLEPRVSLLDALRERLGMTGTKKGCDHGQCGACTVLVDGRRVNACLTLAIMVQNKEVTTIEGLADGDKLHVLQQAFVTEDALQCGYCTPGQIMSAAGLLKENRAHTDDEIREHMSGNICRCGAYTNIIRAIQSARAAVPT